MFTEWLQKNSTDNFYFDRIVYPKASDRDFWENLPENTKKVLIENAEKYVGFEYPIVRATDYLAFIRTGNRTIGEDRYFARRTALHSLLCGECAEHKGRFLDDIINGVFAICEESYWGLPAHVNLTIDKILPNAKKPGIDLFAAETAVSLALVYYMLFDEINAVVPELLGRIERETEKNIFEPFLTMDFWWMGNNIGGAERVNNWNPWILSNILTVYTIMQKDEKKKKDGIARIMTLAENFVKGHPTDGGCDEGPSYWTESSCALYEIAEQLNLTTNGKINFYGEPLLRKMAEYIGHVYIGGDYYVNFADSPARLNSLAAPVAFRFAKNTGLDSLAALSASLYLRKNCLVSDVKRLRRYITELMGIKEELRYGGTFALEHESVMESVQIVTAREGTDEKGFFVAVKGGHNAESHNHNDVGTYVVYYDGEPLIIDAGSGEYTRQLFSPERKNIWFVRSEWHNLPSVDGGVQLEGKEHRAKDFRYDFSDEKVTVSADIAAAYGSETLEKLGRTLVFTRGSESGVTVTDVFSFGADGIPVTENLLFIERPEISDGKITIYTKGKKKSFTLDVSCGSGYSVSLEAKPIGGIRNFERSWDGGELTRAKFDFTAAHKTVFSVKITKEK